MKFNHTPKAGKLFTAKMYTSPIDYVYCVVATPGKCSYWMYNPETRRGLESQHAKRVSRRERC